MDKPYLRIINIERKTAKNAQKDSERGIRKNSQGKSQDTHDFPQENQFNLGRFNFP